MKNTILILMLMMTSLVHAETDKYRAIWRTNPATDMTIAWNQVNSTTARVYYDYIDYGSDYSRYRNVKEVDRTVSDKWMDNCFARLTDLQPSTVYYFLIVDKNSVSDRFSFKTAPDNPNQPISIVAGGDSRNNQEARRNANLMVAKLRPDCVMFGGDYNAISMFWEWKTWLDDWQLTIAPDGRMTPIVAARGNHEPKNKDIVNIFDVPHPSVYYSLEIGGDLIKLFTLNSEISVAGDQATWLVDELKASNHFRFKMAQYHRPIRPHVSYKTERQRQYEAWAFPFYDYGMDVVVECDAHTVKITHPIKPVLDGEEGFQRDDANGTIYVGEGCWGAPLRNNDDDKSWTQASGMFNQFKWFFVSKEEMEMRTVKTDNAAEVSYLTDETKFTLPDNIDLWQPDSGTVLKVAARDAVFDNY